MSHSDNFNEVKHASTPIIVRKEKGENIEVSGELNNNCDLTSNMNVNEAIKMIFCFFLFSPFLECALKPISGEQLIHMSRQPVLTWRGIQFHNTTRQFM